MSLSKDCSGANTWRFNLLLGRQELQWRDGMPISVEQIIQQSTTPFTDDQQMSLICNEIFIRESLGQKPSLEEYQHRFNHLAEMLAIQWQIDHLFSPLNANDTPKPSDSTFPPSGDRSTSVPPSSDRYIIQSQIGAGGMGVVYRATDNRLNRTVAFKVLSTHLKSDAQAMTRFFREAELIARINHSHTIPIYDSGEIAQGQFIVMEYCVGGSLAEYLREGPLPTSVAAEIVRQTAEGISAAHAASVVHRDLKPSNVLLVAKPQTRDKVPHIKVTDFGLAARIDTSDDRSHVGGILGTPPYMAPELLSSEIKSDQTLLDIYALGAILYECLTGRPPIRGANSFETLKLLATQTPAPIRSLQPNVPVDLATVAHKCLQRDPNDRYQTAQEVADDIHRFLNGHPIKARPASVWLRSWKWAHRNPLTASGLGLLAMLLLAFFGMWAWFTHDLKQARDRALEQQAIAQAQAQRAQRNAGWAMEAVDNLITKVGDKQLANIPGMSETRKNLLGNAVTFCEKFLVDQDNTDPRALNEVALAHRRLAKIHRALAENELWLKHVQSAATIHRKLAQEWPNSEEYLVELGKSLNNLSNAEGELVSKEQAAKTAKESVAIKEQLVKLSPTSVEYRSTLATSLMGTGRGTDSVTQEASLLRAEQLLQSIIDEVEDDGPYRSQLCLTYRNYCALLDRLGRYNDGCSVAKKLVQQAQLIQKSQTSVQSQFDAALSYDVLGSMLLRQFQFDESIQAHQAAISLLYPVVSQFPEHTVYVSQYARSYQNLANTFREAKRFDEAIDCIEKGLQKLHTIDSKASTSSIDTALLQSLQSIIQLEANNLDLALKQADGHLQRFAQVDRANVREPNILGVDIARGLALLGLNRTEEARQQFNESWEIVRSIAKSEPSNAEYCRLLFLTGSNLILLDLRQGNIESATNRIQQIRDCDVMYRLHLIPLLQAACDASQGNHAQAIAIIEQNRESDVGAIWPDNLLLTTTRWCIEKAAADPKLSPPERAELLKRYQATEKDIIADYSRPQSLNPFKSKWLEEQTASHHKALSQLLSSE